MSDPVRIGLLGRGTVGGAFAGLLAERAGAVEAATGRRPEIVGTLTRGEGDFSEILGRSDVVVELIGGTDPARTYVLDALRAGRPSSPPTSSCSPSTARSSSASPARPACSCASRPRSPA